MKKFTGYQSKLLEAAIADAQERYENLTGVDYGTLTDALRDAFIEGVAWELRDQKMRLGRLHRSKKP